jgi:DNA-binding winged helix-turn-helix (wHTH) protein
MVPTNPFFHRGPIRDRGYFFGREAILARVRVFLSAGQSVALVGPRRIGKTSLLFRLLERPADVVDSAPPFHSVYLDCERWVQLSAPHIYQQLADALRRSLGELAAPPAAPGNHDPLTELETLACRAAERGLQVALLLDEFEALSANPQLDSEFFGGLRALAMEHGLAYLTVSTRPLLELTYARVQPRSSPFFNFFALLRIGLFTRAESLELLQTLSARGGSPFSPSFCAQLIAWAGDHPFFLQMIGDAAFERIAAGASQTNALAVNLLRGPFGDEARDHWQFFWRSVAPDDQRLLALLPVLVPGQEAGVRRLAEAGLIVADTNPPALVSHGFQAFVAEQALPGLLQAPPFTLDLSLRLVLLGTKPIAVSPQQFALLAHLIEQRHRVVSNEELAMAVWKRNDPGTYESLRTALKELRTALGRAKTCVQNVRGQGYRFVVDTGSGEEAAPSA